MKKLVLFSTLLLGSLHSTSSFAQFLSLSWPLDRSVIQQAGGYGSVYVAGQLVGCPDGYDKLQMRIERLDKYGSYASLVQDYTDISRDNGGMGLYREEAYLSNGWYHIIVKATNGGGGIVAINDVRFGVGNVFIIAGQSNAQSIGASGNPGVPPTLPSDTPYDCVVSNNWIGDCDWVTSTSPNYIPFPLFPVFQKLWNGNKIAPTGYNNWAYTRLGNQQVDNTGAPVAFFNVAYGGTDIAAWKSSADGNPVSGMAGIGWPCSPVTGKNLPANSGLPYLKLKHALNYYGSLFGARGVLWHQGESETDHAYATNGSYNSDYYNKLSSVIGKSRSDYGYNIPWFVSAPATYYSYKNLGIIGLTNASVQSDQSSVAASTGSGASTDGINYQYRHPEDFVHLNENPSYQGLTALANSWQNALGSSGYGVAAQTVPSVSLQYNSGAGIFTAYAPSGYSDYKWVNGNGDLDSGTGGGSSAYSAVLGTGMRCWVKNSNGNWSLTPMVYPQSCTSGARKAAISEPGEADFGYKLSVFPNPSSVHTTVQFEIPYPANVEVDFIDVTGQVKQTVTKNRHDKGAFTYPVNIASLPVGIYYCRLKAGDVSIIKKMVVGSK